MAKDKEKSINPAQQARKQEKNRALKKAKSEQQARRNEKFARRNPDRIQRQIDDLKALEASGEIKPREKAILADLERDLRAVVKARETLGEKAPTFGNAQPRRDRHDNGRDGANRSSVLGKRGRDGERRTHPGHPQHLDSGEETDESVRAIPMPRDTPPPIPREFRPSYNRQNRYHQHTGLDDDGGGQKTQDAEQNHNPVTVQQQKTTYSAAPQIRDLRKEAPSRFVPAAVKKKQDAIRGVGGGLLEPEEMDRLEAAGYYNRNTDGGGGGEQPEREPRQRNDAETEAEAEARRLAAEEANFERELAAVDAAVGHDMDVDEEADAVGASKVHVSKTRHVEIEEVEDEDI